MNSQPKQHSEAVKALAQRVVERLADNGLTLATAESCTGGELAYTFATTPGSGDIFQGGFVCYSKRAKERALGVSPAVLGQDTAVSRRVVEAMARGARERMDCDLAVAITGVTGPEPDEDGNPVGLVHVAVAARAGNTDHLEQRLEGLAPETLREEAILGALRMLDAALDRRSSVPRADEGGSHPTRTLQR